ncbi:MAG: GGDEF domain-containing protein, partial [Phycisphaerales bacterium JB038]
DIDHFKRFNDTFGHEVGDRVLQMVAKTLTHACRSYDLAGRWGGEEFVVLAGRGEEAAVTALAERLRSLVAQSNLDCDEMQLGVTVSLGATVARPDDDAESLFERADRLLYQSKEAGRNLCSFAA